MSEGYDYIVVGAGSSGATLAARLAEYSDAQVLLVEAGGKADHWSVHMPLGYYINYAGGPFNWAYHSTAQSELAGRKIYQPRGKGLGGSSAINGMAFLRGNPRDYDRWEAEGATGWSFSDVLPYFKRLEKHFGGETEWRGGLGPVAINKVEFHSPSSEAFLEAGQQAGFRFCEDFNGPNQEGFGYFDANIDGGVRQSTARAYLRTRRPNLHIKTDSDVVGLATSGTRVTGVQLKTGRQSKTIWAEQEVILSAGAFSSPQILMLSGIGPAEHLRTRGIDVLLDLPGVGQNLQDHLEVHISWEGPVNGSLNRYGSLPWKMVAGARWFLTKSGICATNGVQAGAFTRSETTIAHPDIQYHFFPFFLKGLDLPSSPGGFCICVGTLRARSRGSVSLASPDPAEVPRIDFNYLSEPQDLVDLKHCVEQARDVAEQSALKPFGNREENDWREARTPDQIAQKIRERAESAYHPCGTCKIGEDPLSVIDPSLRVHGMEGLRVADASVIPSVTSGNLNAPCIMIGEKAADHVLDRC